MNLLQIFADKRRLDLALTLSRHPKDEQHRAEVLRRAGIAEHQHAAFLEAVQAFDVLRQRANCNDCLDADACLDDNLLAEFVDGVLHPDDLPETEGHLAHCGSCLQKAVTLAQWTEELAPAPAWPQVVVGMMRKGLQLLAFPESGFTRRELTAVPVLSSGAAEQAAAVWSLADGEMLAEFAITTDGSGVATLCVKFQAAGIPVREGRVSLRLEEALLESLPLPATGEVCFRDLTPGSYVLELESEFQPPKAFEVTLQPAA